KLLAARFAGFDCPGTLEFPDLLLEVRLLVCEGTGRSETDGAEQCHKKDSHTSSPWYLEDSDTVAKRPRSAAGPAEWASCNERPLGRPGLLQRIVRRGQLLSPYPRPRQQPTDSNQPSGCAHY